MADCVLIAVSYRNADGLERLLATVPGAAGPLSWHVVVVNNDPEEDLGPVVSGIPEVEVVEAGDNLGYAGGINLGLIAAPASRWTVFLNPDVMLTPGSLVRMARAAGETTAVVPVIEDDDGRLQSSMRREPTVLRSLGDALLGARWATRPAWLGETVLSTGPYETGGEVDWATGAVLLVPTPAVTAVGPWDERRFFLYSEETDYFRRLRNAGCSVRFLPDAQVSHEGAGSGTSDALHALQEVNRVRYFRKWHRAPSTAAFWGVAVLNNTLRVHRPAARAALRALLIQRERARLPGGIP